MSLEEYIDTFVEGSQAGAQEKRGYLAQHALFEQIPQLKEDFQTPSFCHQLLVPSFAPRTGATAAACPDACSRVLLRYLGRSPEHDCRRR